MGRSIRFLLGSVVRRVSGWQPYPATVDVACDLCGSRSVDVVARRVSFEMRYRNVLCTSCGLVYLSPRPDDAAFADFYANLYSELYGAGRAGDADATRGRAVVAYLAEAVDLRAQRGLFDIGCGEGGLLRAAAADARTANAALAGCDPGYGGADGNRIRESGREILIFKQNVEGLGEELRAYSLFTLYDVLEHLLSPRAFLETLHRSTAGDAALFISTSCLDNWREIPPAGWERYYLRLAHTYTYTVRTLDALLRATGWEPTHRRRAPKGDQWVVAAHAGPQPDAPTALSDHASEVRAMIAAYRGRAGR